MIDKKRSRKSLIIISLIIIIMFAAIQIRKTLARYQTAATGEADVDVAFWIVGDDFKSETIVIDNVYPSAEETFSYTFSVSNFDATKSAETDLEYDIVLTSTTNLPLSYELVKLTTEGETETETPLTVVEDLYEDTNDTVYKEMTLEAATNELKMPHETDTTQKFKIKVKFPEVYSENLEYADKMESIKLNLTARQVIEE